MAQAGGSAATFSWLWNVTSFGLFSVRCACRAVGILDLVLFLRRVLASSVRLAVKLVGLKHEKFLGLQLRSRQFLHALLIHPAFPITSVQGPSKTSLYTKLGCLPFWPVHLRTPQPPHFL